ncbi:ATP-NAD kinase [Nesidiocoris tenuis]|uniref:NAD(+) kinase n=1 Tax=Nesidiocoris tenuis TaxID=355587 RepID=A0ABN7ATW0_9HEMI|nr:ATP-NAD kinase [Nesidiocoris tenuis]
MQKSRLVWKKILTGYERTFSSDCSPRGVKLKKILLLKKRTRYELEKLSYPQLSYDEYDRCLRIRGTDLESLLQTTKIHQQLSDKLESNLRNAGFQVDVIDRTQYTPDAIEWADLIVTAGGDGTFLIAASEIQNRDKPLLGFNTNPSKSTGYLCLPCSVNNEAVVNRLKNDDFLWKFRTRIEVKLTGQFLKPDPERIGLQNKIAFDCPDVLFNQGAPAQSKILPSKALNEVFFAEKRPSLVSNFIVSLPGRPRTHVKCSGVCVSTGTGSTSWHMSMNRISLSKVHKLLELAKIESSPDHLVELMTAFNDSLQFPYDDPRVHYTIRDMIVSPITPDPSGILPGDFTTAISVASKCYTADVVVDGTHAWPFNDGTQAELSTRPEIALRTLHFPNLSFE